MFTSLNIKLIAAVVSILLLLGLLTVTYAHIKQTGYLEAQAECDKKFKEYQLQIDAKLEQLSTSLATNTDILISNNENLTQDISSILSRVKKQSNITIKNGKCVTSDQYVKDVNAAIDRVNADIGGKK